ncbi:MAG: hypothetical protein WCF17_22170 [Terracidiphilus sp.]
MPSARLTLHRLFPAAAFYFFFNAAGLPSGLFFTTLLSPFLYVWLYCKGQRWLTLKFLLAFSPFLAAHLIQGIDSRVYYARSLLLLWTVFIATYAICWTLSKTARAERLFDQLIAANFIATGIACLAFPTPLGEVLWTQDTGTFSGGSAILRLKLFGVEPSAYAYMMMPLLVFASMRLFQKPNPRSLLYFLMIVIPLLLTQSFGGISIGIAAVGISLLVTNPRFFKRAGSLAALCFCLIFLVGLMVTHNPISQRVFQVASGGDSSTRSRTLLAFILAYAVASTRSLVWGAGLGQVKLFDFSSLNLGIDTSVIPNSIAANFAELGAVGVVTKLAVEGWLFFKTRVYRDGFRLACFIVGFIFQFTGGYIMNVQEYMLWFFAFWPSVIDPAVFTRTKTNDAGLAE